MPSDCQCSACACETRIVTKVINNKQASKLLRELEEEVERLKDENWFLKDSLKKYKKSKSSLIKELKNHLDSI